jgi:uncharacterized protein YxjI
MFNKTTHNSSYINLALCSLPLLATLSGCGATNSEYGIDTQTRTIRTEIPTTFVAQAKLISIGTDMVLKDDNGEFGKVQQRVLNWTKTFEYYDGSNTIKAKAKQKAFSFGVKIDIVDGNNVAIGSVEEKVFQSIFKIKTSYSIKDPQGIVLAESEKLDWAGTTVEIKNKSGQVVATMKRPYFDLGAATWNVTINQDPGFDKRLIIFIPAFKTAADAERD